MQNEIWQVVVGDKLYEADFIELTHWIAQRSLLPCDLVKKGNLRWIEAEKIPALQKHFSGEAGPLDRNVNREQVNLDVCYFHEEEEAVFTCKKCAKCFCQKCPKHHVKIQKCPVCTNCNHKKEIVHEYIKTRYCPICSEIIEKKNLPQKTDKGKTFGFEKLKRMFASK